MKRSTLIKAAGIAAGGLMLLSVAAPVGATSYSGIVYFNRVVPEIRSADPNSTGASSIFYKGNTKDVRVSPDGTWVAFLRAYDSGNYNLWVVQQNGNDLRNVTDDGTINVDSYDWNPNSIQLAWSDGDDLFEVFADGSHLGQLTNTAGLDTDPHYRIDGNMLAFNRDASGNKDVWTYSLLSAVSQNITNNVADDEITANGNPWNHQGSSGTPRIVFQTDRNGNFDIYRCLKNGGGLHQVTQHTDDQIDASYSPNGNYITYRRQHFGSNYMLELTDALGTYLHSLTRGGDVSRYSWSPQTDAVVMSRAISGPASYSVVTVNTAGTIYHTVEAMSAINGLSWGLDYPL